MDLGGPKEQDRYTKCRVPLGCFQGWSGLLWSGLLWSSLGASAASEASEAIRFLRFFHMLQDCPSLREIFNRKSMLAKVFFI